MASPGALRAVKSFPSHASDAPYAVLAREMKRQRERSRWPFTDFASGLASYFRQEIADAPSPIPPRWSPASGLWRAEILRVQRGSCSGSPQRRRLAGLRTYQVRFTLRKFRECSPGVRISERRRVVTEISATRASIALTGRELCDGTWVGQCGDFCGYPGSK